MIIGTFTDERGNPISVSWEEVTPATAREWLASNTESNRQLNAAQVDAISEDILEGYWRFNGATVAFDRDGKMLDSQHRCSAIVRADAPVMMLVLRGLDPEAMKWMGQERPRSTRDLLRTSGRKVANDNEAVAIASIICQTDGELKDRITTRPHLADFVWEHRETLAPLASWASGVIHGTDLYVSPTHPYSNGKQDRKAATTSALGALAYIQVIRHGADMAYVQQFWEAVFNGVASDEQTRTAVKSIRNYLRVTSPLLRVGGGASATGLLKAYDTLIRSYNRWLEGEPVERIVPGRNPVKELADLTRSAA